MALFFVVINNLQLSSGYPLNRYSVSEYEVARDEDSASWEITARFIIVMVHLVICRKWELAFGIGRAVFEIEL